MPSRGRSTSRCTRSQSRHAISAPLTPSCPRSNGHGPLSAHAHGNLRREMRARERPPYSPPASCSGAAPAPRRDRRDLAIRAGGARLVDFSDSESEFLEVLQPVSQLRRPLELQIFSAVQHFAFHALKFPEQILLAHGAVLRQFFRGPAV